MKKLSENFRWVRCLAVFLFVLSSCDSDEKRQENLTAIVEDWKEIPLTENLISMLNKLKDIYKAESDLELLKHAGIGNSKWKVFECSIEKLTLKVKCPPEGLERIYVLLGTLDEKMIKKTEDELLNRSPL